LIDSAVASQLPPPLATKMVIVLPPHGSGMLSRSFATHSSPARSTLRTTSSGLIAQREAFGAPTELRHLTPAEQRERALRLVQTWNPGLRRMVAESAPDCFQAISPSSSLPLKAPAWPSGNVTLLGDAVHTMTPLQGLGANTAFRDASLLAQQLARVQRGQTGLVSALQDYEAAMLTYGFAAVRQSLRVTEQFASDNPSATTPSRRSCAPRIGCQP
jgi:2-polyprenyl-6-methoxyphenol hydroxylase-like FAD-dependent oxidoreductase